MKLWPDVAVALVAAIVFAIVVDALRIGSLLREGVRHAKNRAAEYSVSHLRRRIAQLSRIRDKVQLYAQSDRALLLMLMRFFFGTLMYICVGVVLALVSNVPIPSLAHIATVPAPLPGNKLRSELDAFSIMMFLSAGAMAGLGMKNAFVDTKSLMKLEVAKVDFEIQQLNDKLFAKLGSRENVNS